MKLNRIFLGLTTIALLFAFAFTIPKKNVLIIGDSISIGYFPTVKKDLVNEAEVFHNPGNAQHTGTGLRMLDKWLGDQKYDVIVFNWGLWDLCYRHPESTVQGRRDKLNGEITYTVDVYEKNIEELVKRLKKTSAKLVFVTTTMIPPDEAGRFEGDEITYNDAAKAVMKKYDVEICDLHKHSIDIHKKYKLKDGDVHYTAEGYQKLAEPVISAIKQALK
ncbi:SGNH/GDSL hydrolase family protein [Pseudopedobacter beijingensis]|uniref:SGNH/GDSL hydrolase family protein n=1 Tax=Pseudopedobacter beijingensis TaxID=1207056 RepID=A0ABW4IBN9_9SPHI